MHRALRLVWRDGVALWIRAGSGSRALYLGGLLLVASGLAHLPVHLLSGADWEGPLAWRKPILFGVSTGATLLSLGWVLGRLAPRREDDLVGGAVALAAVFEVAVITVQTWRGVPSHFNTSTPLDATLYRSIEAGVAILGFGLLWLAIRSVGPPLFGALRLDAPQRLALRVGMALLVAGALLGVVMTVLGHAAIARGDEPGRFGRAGVLKFAHGAPLHAVQALPLTAWLLDRLRASRRLEAVGAMALGFTAFTLFAAVQTFGGRARFDLTVASTGLLVVASLGLVAPLIPAARALAPR